MSLLQSDAPIESIAFLKNSISPQHPRVLVVVPTRNTARTLEETVRRIPAGVVDDLLVQVPIKGGWKSCGPGHWAFTFGHHFGHRFSRPLKRMGMVIPFRDKGHQPL